MEGRGRENLLLNHNDYGKNLVHHLRYMVRTPWCWVFEEAHRDVNLHEVLGVDDIVQLSTFKSFTSSPDFRKSGPSTLRAEISEIIGDNTSIRVKMVVLGSSAALEGLSDKDEFVRTLMSNGAEYSIPPSILIDWDATEETISKITFPVCDISKDNSAKKNTDSAIVSVLKTPLGSRGEGVFFVSTHEEIVLKVKSNYERAIAEGNGKFIKDIKESKGRIPAWVLSGEIKSIQVMSRKCHMRTYVAIVEQPNAHCNNHDIIWDGYIYNRHEVRVAERSILKNCELMIRDRRAHITNGASSGETGRYVLDEIDELVSLDMGNKLTVFVEQIFHCLTNEITNRILNRRSGIPQPENRNQVKIALAGIDIMSDSNGRLYLLEVNVNPAAPPKEFVSTVFRNHLVNFAKDTLHLAFSDPEKRMDAVGGWIPMMTKIDQY